MMEQVDLWSQVGWFGLATLNSKVMLEHQYGVKVQLDLASSSLVNSYL